MKKTLSLSLFSLGIIMVGCSDDQRTVVEEKEIPKTKEAVKTTQHEPEDEKPEELPQSDLDVMEFEGSKVELVNKIEVGEVYKADPFELTMNSVSLFTASELSYETEYMLSWKYDVQFDPDEEEFSFILFDYNVKNTSQDSEYYTNGMTEVSFVVEGKQEVFDIFWSELDIINSDEEDLDADSSYYMPDVNKDGQLALIIKSDPKLVTDVNIKFGGALEEEEEYVYAQISPDIEETFTFTIDEDL